MQLFLNIFCRIANSIDSDKTAPSALNGSESALFAHAILSETLVLEILEYLP